MQNTGDRTLNKQSNELVAAWRKFHVKNKHLIIDETLGYLNPIDLAGWMIEELGSVEAALRFFCLGSHGAGMAARLIQPDVIHRSYQTKILLMQAYEAEHPEMFQTTDGLVTAWNSSNQDYYDLSLSAEALAGGVVVEVVREEEGTEGREASAAAHEIRRRLYDYTYRCTGSGTHPLARQALFLLELASWQEDEKNRYS